MRRLFLVLMIALLPLRGWVGDVMAMEMTAVKLAPSLSLADESAPAHHADGVMAADMEADHAMPSHCAEYAGAHPAPENGASDCNTCTACQICHAVVLAPSFPILASRPLPVDRPLAVAHRFASAERAPGFKPPIL